MVPLIAHCAIFQTMPTLLAKPDEVQSLASIDSLDMFVDVIGGTEPDTTDDNARDLGRLSDEFKFPALSTTVAN
jgi:hypothetical protein